LRASGMGIFRYSYLFFIVVCAVLVLPPVHAQSCGCPAEYDWVFDVSPTQTWITVKVTLHHSSYDRQINFGNSWRFYFPSPNSVDSVAAYTADTNQTLNFRVEKNQTAVSISILFGGAKPDGFAFYVKWLDSEMPRIVGDQLEAEWTHPQRAFPAPHPETYHLWLPPGYSAPTVTSVPSSTPKTSTQDGRTYVSFSATGQSHTDFSWRLVAKQASQGTLGNILPISTLQQVLGGAATGASILLGWFIKTRKRRFLSGYLTRIDSTYNEYAVNREECKSRLEKMKEDVLQMLKKGKLDEAHFAILDGKITQYIKDLDKK